MISRANSPRLAFRLLGARRGSGAAAALFRATGMFGKDLLHHAGIFVLMLLIPVILLYIEPAIKFMQGMIVQPEGLREPAGNIFLIMLAASAFVFGLVLTADEVESRTILFLDTLPARPYNHFLRKLATALVLLVTWTVVEALLLGALSRQGSALLRALVKDGPTFLTALNIGRGGLVTVIQTLSLVLTGLVAGCFFRNLAASALVGMAGYLLYLVFVSNLLIGLDLPRAVADQRTALGLIVWCVLMVVAWPRAFRRTEFKRSDAATRVESSSRVWSRGTSLLNFRLHGLPFDPPNRYLLRIPLVLLAAVSGVVCFTLPQATTPSSGFLNIWILLLGFAVALVGSSSWLPEEREGGRFFLYTLPCSRGRIFWPRICTLVVGNLVLGVVTIICLAVGIYLQASPSHRDTMFTTVGVAVPGIWIVTTVSLGLLGALFRLFFRNPFTPAVLASVVGGVWAILSGMTLNNSVSPVPGGASVVLPGMGAQILQMTWNFLLPIAMPVLAGYVAFCHTRLLELPEKTRATLALILFFALLLWGGLLLTAAPAHFWTILVG